MPGAMVGVVCRPEVGNPGLGADVLVESLGRVALHPRHSHDSDQIPADREDRSCSAAHGCQCLTAMGGSSCAEPWSYVILKRTVRSRVVSRRDCERGAGTLISGGGSVTRPCLGCVTARGQQQHHPQY